MLTGTEYKQRLINIVGLAFLYYSKSSPVEVVSLLVTLGCAVENAVKTQPVSIHAYAVPLQTVCQDIFIHTNNSPARLR